MANVNNYIAAGRASVKKNLIARKALSDNKTDFGALGQEAIKAERDKKIAVIRSNAKVANASADAMTQVKGAEIRVDRDKSIANSKRSARKAGMLAAGVQALGMANYLNKKKDETNPMLANYQSLIDNNSGRLADADQKIADAQSVLDGFKDTSGKPSVTKPTSGKPSATNPTSMTDQGSPVSTSISAQQSSSPDGVMSKQSIKDLAISAGFTPDQAGIVVGIAGGESGYDPTNSTKRLKGGLYDTTGEDSVGLMQINWGYHKDSGWLQGLGINSREDLFDPAKNMKAAKYLYDGRGGFGDWTVYNEGLYKDKM